MDGPVQVTYYDNFLGKHVCIDLSFRNTTSLDNITTYFVVHDLKRCMISIFFIEMHLVFLKIGNAKTCYFSDFASNY